MLIGYIGHSEGSTINAEVKTAFENKFNNLKKYSYKSDKFNFELTQWVFNPDSQCHFSYFENDTFLFVVIGRLFNLDRFDFNQFCKQYVRNGINCINDLDGEFAGVLIDKARNTSYVFKDHLGTVPISLYKDNEGLYFYSNERTFTKQIIKRVSISTNYLESLFYSFAPNYSISPNPQFLKVLGGSYVEFHAFENVRYWELNKIKPKINITRAKVISELSRLLDESISRRMINSGQNIGVHISGGLDSALIAGKINKLKQDRTLIGFSWSPPVSEYKGDDLEYDERDFVIELSNLLQIKIAFSSYKKEDLKIDLEDWELPIDFPFERDLLKKAKNEQVRVIFTGFGGDEFIGLQNSAFLHLLFKKGNWRTFLKFKNKSSFIETLKFIVNEGLYPLRRKPMLTKKYSDKLLPYFAVKTDNNAKGTYQQMCESPQHYIQSIINVHHIEARCEQWYNLGMSHGIRYSHPFLDKTIVEFCYSLPASIYYEQYESKTLIRELAAEYSTTAMKHLERTLDPALFSHSASIDRQALPELISSYNAIDDHSYFNFINTSKISHAANNLSTLNEEEIRALIYVLKYYLTAHNLIKELNS